MEIIELITNVAIMVCLTVLAIVFVGALIDTIKTKVEEPKRKEKERKEFLETMQLISDIFSKEEEKPKKKITKKKEEK